MKTPILHLWAVLCTLLPTATASIFKEMRKISACDQLTGFYSCMWHSCCWVEGEVMGYDKHRCISSDVTVLDTGIAEVHLNPCGVVEQVASSSWGLAEVDYCRCSDVWIWINATLGLLAILALAAGLIFGLFKLGRKYYTAYKEKQTKLQGKKSSGEAKADKGRPGN